MEEDLGRMNGKNRNQIAILTLLLVALAYSLSTGLKDENLTSGPVRKSTPAEVNKNSATMDALPRIDLLNRKAPEFTDISRNVFEFAGQAPAMNIPLDEDNTGIAADADEEPEETFPDVRYLGFYQEKDRPKVKLAAISNSGRIYVGRVGQVLAGKYQVLEIQSDFVRLKYIPEQKIVRCVLGKSNLPVLEGSGSIQ